MKPKNVRSLSQDKLALTTKHHPWQSLNHTTQLPQEHLGVLAVMGILSVVGISAFNSAMERHRANTLIQEAQKRAVVVAGQIGFNNQTPSLAEFSPYNTTSSGTFGDVKTTGLTGQFGISVSNVNKSICQNILNTIGDKTPIRRLSHETTPTTPITSCDEDNAFLFIYNNDMQGGESDTEYATDDSSCKSVCGVFNPNTHLCDESDCTPPENECETDNQCNSENECMVCDTESGLCKNGCERVQYIESNGSQYIDTGIAIGNNQFSADVKMAWISGPHIMGMGTNSGYSGQCISLVVQEDKFSNLVPGCCYYQFDDATSDTINFTWTVSDRVSAFSGDITGSTNNYAYRNGASARSSTLQLFRISTGGGGATPSKMKFYSVKIRLGGDVIADFVPVLSPETSEYGGKACMLNKVKKDGKLKLYCDANGGTFKTNKD